jgi:hypothetical protein
MSHRRSQREGGLLDVDNDRWQLSRCVVLQAYISLSESRHACWAGHLASIMDDEGDPGTTAGHGMRREASTHAEVIHV